MSTPPIGPPPPPRSSIPPHTKAEQRSAQPTPKRPTVPSSTTPRRITFAETPRGLLLTKLNELSADNLLSKDQVKILDKKITELSLTSASFTRLLYQTPFLRILLLYALLYEPDQVPSLIKEPSSKTTERWKSVITTCLQKHLLDHLLSSQQKKLLKPFILNMGGETALHLSTALTSQKALQSVLSSLQELNSLNAETFPPNARTRLMQDFEQLCRHDPTCFTQQEQSLIFMQLLGLPNVNEHALTFLLSPQTARAEIFFYGLLYAPPALMQKIRTKQSSTKDWNSLAAPFILKKLNLSPKTLPPCAFLTTVAEINDPHLNKVAAHLIKTKNPLITKSLVTEQDILQEAAKTLPDLKTIPPETATLDILNNALNPDTVKKWNQSREILKGIAESSLLFSSLSLNPAIDAFFPSDELCDVLGSSPLKNRLILFALANDRDITEILKEPYNSFAWNKLAAGFLHFLVNDSALTQPLASLHPEAASFYLNSVAENEGIAISLQALKEVLTTTLQREPRTFSLLHPFYAAIDTFADPYQRAELHKHISTLVPHAQKIAQWNFSDTECKKIVLLLHYKPQLSSLLINMIKREASFPIRDALSNLIETYLFEDASVQQYISPEQQLLLSVDATILTPQHQIHLLKNTPDLPKLCALLRESPLYQPLLAHALDDEPLSQNLLTLLAHPEQKESWFALAPLFISDLLQDSVHTITNRHPHLRQIHEGTYSAINSLTPAEAIYFLKTFDPTSQSLQDFADHILVTLNTHPNTMMTLGTLHTLVESNVYSQKERTLLHASIVSLFDYANEIDKCNLSHKEQLTLIFRLTEDNFLQDLLRFFQDPNEATRLSLFAPRATRYTLDSFYKTIDTCITNPRDQNFLRTQIQKTLSAHTQKIAQWEFSNREREKIVLLLHYKPKVLPNLLKKIEQDTLNPTTLLTYIETELQSLQKLLSPAHRLLLSVNSAVLNQEHQNYLIEHTSTKERANLCSQLQTSLSYQHLLAYALDKHPFSLSDLPLRNVLFHPDQKESWHALTLPFLSDLLSRHHCTIPIHALSPESAFRFLTILSQHDSASSPAQFEEALLKNLPLYIDALTTFSHLHGLANTHIHNPIERERIHLNIDVLFAQADAFNLNDFTEEEQLALVFRCAEENFPDKMEAFLKNPTPEARVLFLKPETKRQILDSLRVIAATADTLLPEDQNLAQQYITKITPYITHSTQNLIKVLTEKEKKLFVKSLTTPNAEGVVKCLKTLSEDSSYRPEQAHAALLWEIERTQRQETTQLIIKTLCDSPTPSKKQQALVTQALALKKLSASTLDLLQDSLQRRGQNITILLLNEVLIQKKPSQTIATWLIHTQSFPPLNYGNFYEQFLQEISSALLSTPTFSPLFLEKLKQIDHYPDILEKNIDLLTQDQKSSMKQKIAHLCVALLPGQELQFVHRFLTQELSSEERQLVSFALCHTPPQEIAQYLTENYKGSLFKKIVGIRNEANQSTYDVALQHKFSRDLCNELNEARERVFCDEVNESLNNTLSVKLLEKLYYLLQNDDNLRIALEALVKRSQKTPAELIQDTLDTLLRSTPTSPPDSLEAILLKQWTHVCGHQNTLEGKQEALKLAKRLAKNPEDVSLKPWITTVVFVQQKEAYQKTIAADSKDKDFLLQIMQDIEAHTSQKLRNELRGAFSRLCCDEVKKSLNGTFSAQLSEKLYGLLRQNDNVRIALEALVKRSQKTPAELIQDTLDTLLRSTPTSPPDSFEAKLLKDWTDVCGYKDTPEGKTQALELATQLANDPNDVQLKPWIPVVVFLQQETDYMQQILTIIDMKKFTQENISFLIKLMHSIKAHKFYINEQLIENGIAYINTYKALKVLIGPADRAIPHVVFEAPHLLEISTLSEIDSFHSTANSLVFNVGKSTGIMVRVTLKMPQEIENLPEEQRWEKWKKYAEIAAVPKNTQLSLEMCKWKAEASNALNAALEKMQAPYQYASISLNAFLDEVRSPDQERLYLRTDKTLSLSPAPLDFTQASEQNQRVFTDWANSYEGESDPTCISPDRMKHIKTGLAQGKHKVQDGPVHIEEASETFEISEQTKVEYYKWISKDEKGRKILVTLLEKKKENEILKEKWMERHVLRTRLDILKNKLNE